MEPSFDIQSPIRKSTTHHSRWIAVIVSLLVVVIGGTLIMLRIKDKRAYDAYLRTPEGQLKALQATSQPVTATDQERYDALSALQKSSGPSTMTNEDGLKALESLQ
jgi:hypothetical protein